MDLALAICQGLGLALAIGIGGPIAALFASMMGSIQVGFNPDGTDYGFLTATWFLVTLLAFAVLTVLARGRDVARIPVVLLLAAAGALAFAASLAEEGETAWPGLIVGALVTGATALVSSDVLDGAIRRAKAAGATRGGLSRDPGNQDGSPEADAANVLIVAFTVAGVIVAALALLVPPVSLIAAIAIIAVALGRRRKAGEKYEGLRILR
jgi:hypothetical protein